MNPQGDQLLSQLRDIHVAPDVSWWPPAPGWWVLAVFVFVALLFLLRYVMQRLRTRARRTGLIRFIDQVARDIDAVEAPQEYLSSLNRVFKIVAMRAFPKQRCASMQGREWTKFLRLHLAGAGPADDLAALAEGPYRPIPAFHAEKLASIARQWVRQHG